MDSGMEQHGKKQSTPEVEHPIDIAANLIKTSSNIIVVTGAGVSTSLGIPDFRSPGGLYEQLESEDIGVDEPYDLFRLESFQENPSRFYALIGRKLLTPLSEDDTPCFTPTHAFIKVLQDKCKLLTNYTQNIDGLEIVAGITRLVQTHGSIAGGRCMHCGKAHKKNFRELWAHGALPTCSQCDQRQQQSLNRRRGKLGNPDATHKTLERPQRSSAKRAIYDQSETHVDYVLRPDIIFFDESLPAKYGERLKEDKGKVDLLIVIGTSLEIEPLAKLPLEDSIRCKPMIWINQKASSVQFQPTVQLLGKCDIVVEELSRRLEWDFDHKMLLRRNAQVEVVEGTGNCCRVLDQAMEQMKEECH